VLTNAILVGIKVAAILRGRTAARAAMHKQHGSSTRIAANLLMYVSYAMRRGAAEHHSSYSIVA
jgi:hypothetical protein